MPQTSWVVTQSREFFCLPAQTEGEPVYAEIQGHPMELPPGSKPLEEIQAASILYYGFLIPMGEKMK